MRHLALLRGLNVGANNRIKMPALISVFEACGCTNVTTYIQSGNVLFDAPARILPKLAALISDTLQADFEITSPVILRTAAELVAVTKHNPFLKRGAASDTLHVGFLAAAPGADAVADLDPNRSPGDAFEGSGRDLYLHLPNGVARTKLTNAWFDTKLKTVCTVRNWNTVLELSKLVG